MNAIVVSTNDQYNIESEESKFATNFKIDINNNQIKNTIEYLTIYHVLV